MGGISRQSNATEKRFFLVPEGSGVVEAVVEAVVDVVVA